ncbi:coilin isoform X2 [Rhineura floridana]|uniref:coilin isoform X2 n=1 Tax=Rhineura floridana TaxID=261503 RepID=UPI002AC869D5|nr:coilin isoform X2 [Rhineura floridana]
MSASRLLKAQEEDGNPSNIHTAIRGNGCENDSIVATKKRVKLEEVIGRDSYDKIANGFGNQSKKQRKRHRHKLEAKDSDSEDEDHGKRKKSKWNYEHLSSQEESATNIQDLKMLKKRRNVVTGRDCIADNRSDDSTCHSRKLKKKADRGKEQGAMREKKKKKERTLEIKNTSQNTNKTLGPSQNIAAKNTIAQPSTKKSGTSSESSTSSDDSDHRMADIKQKLSHDTKVASQHINKTQLASSVKSASKLAAKHRGGNSKTAYSEKAKSQSSSADSASASREQEEQRNSNLKSKLPCNSQGLVIGPASRTKPETSSSESDSSESETCTIKKPKTNSVVEQPLGGNGGKQLPAATCGPAASPSDSRRGRGRGENPFWRGPRVRGCRGMIRGRGRGRGENTNFFYSYNGEQQKQQQLNEAATNTSVIIQNPPVVPKKDYSTLPLLAAPPQIGEKIAFKLLELTENYTPEVSDYKEGKIVSWNPANKELELEMLSFSSVSKEPGKFDLVFQSADGAETIEYAVSQDRKITESWDALIEPRLIVDPANNESSTENGNP